MFYDKEVRLRYLLVVHVYVFRRERRRREKEWGNKHFIFSNSRPT